MHEILFYESKKLFYINIQVAKFLFFQMCTLPQDMRHQLPFPNTSEKASGPTFLDLLQLKGRQNCFLKWNYLYYVFCIWKLFDNYIFSYLWFYVLFCYSCFVLSEFEGLDFCLQWIKPSFCTFVKLLCTIKQLVMYLRLMFSLPCNIISYF